MTQLIDHHVVRIVTHIIMGTENFNFCDEQRTSFQSFQESYRRWKTMPVERFQRPELMIPPIWWLHPNRRHMDRTIDKLVKISHQIIDSFRLNASGKEAEKTVIVPKKSCEDTGNLNDEEFGIKTPQCLIELMIKGGLGNTEIADEVATFLGAGHSTINTSLGMLLFHLAGNAQHQEICRGEVDELFDSKRDVELDMEDFSKLKYLEMCILESLRLTPTVPFFLRELHEPLQIDDSSVMLAGELVLVSVWSLHRNPEIYPDPEKYEPTRFLPEYVKQRHPYSFIPFSMGIRNCIGWKVALMEIKVIMAWILRHFEMHTTDQLKDVKLMFGITLKPERPYNVTFKKRLD